MVAHRTDGSDQATRQWVWGTQYVDEVLFMDVNGDASVCNDCDPDVTSTPEQTTGGADEDRRYIYQQDRNWNVIALTATDDDLGTEGRVVERYAYTPYGEFVVLAGDSGDDVHGTANRYDDLIAREEMYLAESLSDLVN